MEAAVFFVEKVPNFLHHRDRVGFFFRVLAQVDELVKQLVDVGHVEVAGHEQVAAHVVGLAQEGVAGLDAVAAVGSIAQVAQVDVAGEGYVFFDPCGVLEALGLAGEALLNAVLDARKDVLNRLRVGRAVAADVALAGGHVELDSSEARAVLAAVVLLFHHEHHFVQAIKGRPVLVEVVVKGFAQTQEGNAAHSGCKVRALPIFAGHP